MITATNPSQVPGEPMSCTGCAGAKGAPLAAIVDFDSDPHDVVGAAAVVRISLCEECGRDLANAVGFMCIREGGWSKLEPRKRKAPGKAARR